MRHAYMIITHNNFPILEKQLRFLDSENADFFIHVDAKAGAVDFDHFRSIPRYSSVTFVDRLSISWGHDSLVRCELSLLKAAVPGRYDYYHLLSGVDVPVKSRAYIEGFFKNAPGVNYINFEKPEISRRHLERVKFYYPFQKHNIRRLFLRRALRELTAGAQRLTGVDRTKKYPGFVFQKGTQWFSITRDLAEYLVSREAEILDKFHDTFCADELFVQSMVVNSPFRDTLLPTAFDGKHANCCRYIDWQRGNPYTFTDSDYDELIHTGPSVLFARKFDYNASPGIADRLFAYFGE